MPRKKITTEIPERPAASTYHRIFQQDKDGQTIFNELAALYYDRPSHVKGDPYETAYKEGQRSVVAFLIRKCGLAVFVEGADG